VKTSGTSTAPSPTPAATAEPAPRWRQAVTLLATVAVTATTLGLAACATPDRTTRATPRLFTSTARDLEAHLRAVEAAWPQAVATPASPAALNTYNVAVGRVLATIQDQRLGIPWKEPFVTQSYTLSFAPGAINSPLREIYNLTEAIPAASIRIRNAERRVASDGLGVPCVTVREREVQPVGSSRFVPLNGRWLPATFVIDCSTPGRPVGKFFNTQVTQTASLAGTSQPLAYDFTAALEISLGPRFWRRFGLSGLFKPAAHLENSGLFFTESFSPDRIPVIMVHGLASDPHIWQNPMNEILADPVLRENYQLWYFLYPTGLPVPVTARRLRESTRLAIEAYDPKRTAPALKEMVLVGHSMGGLLSRMQVIDSGDDIWGSFFAVPPEQLWVDPRRRRALMDALFFDRSPYVERAIFVATPHRGSDIADFNLVRWVVNFIRLPLDLAGLATEFAQLDVSFFNPALQKFDAFGTRSIDNLSPRHPLLNGLEQRPILVPHHSIIGNRGRSVAPELCSDGVVPFKSAHLPTAVSEKLVPAPHSCAQHPETAAEIVRILHEHLKSLNKPAPRPVRPRR